LARKIIAPLQVFIASKKDLSLVYVAHICSCQARAQAK
jgi:hypothetical protein